ncbi:MAG: hypothetical protein LBI54_09905 [Lachnospiraceae bacterium]|nr:hypothetical protein [Lachnospiraceae bacterium]
MRQLEKDLLLKLYAQMLTIRIFEETLLSLFSQGKIFGTTHTCLGQEAIAVASMQHIVEGDGVFSNHRCHGHFIAYGGDTEALFAEILGNKEGVCAGRGGSQHLCYKTFFSNAIQGGMLPNAAGFALASKLRNENNIAVSFIGDGTLGEGVVYETMNIASLWDIPLLIVVEDNGYAQTTPKHLGVAGNICDRAKAFAIACREIESNDVVTLFSEFANAFAYVRDEKKPFCQVVKTYRLGPHSKGDDFRAVDEIKAWEEKNPLLLAEKYISPSEREAVTEKTKNEVRKSLENAGKGTPEALEGVFGGIYQLTASRTMAEQESVATERYCESLNRALHYIFATYAETVLIGEDISDPYGGSFKVTKGLSTKFPQRVFSSPISEAAIAGIGGGLALNKMRPIVEIMFGDFVTLMYDQIINHQAKFSWMYKNQAAAAVLYRMPTGGKRGYGPTHSQSLERIFFGIPNITVIAPTPYHNPGQLLLNAYLHMAAPVVFIENKAFYAEKLMVESEQKQGDFYTQSGGSLFPTLRLAPSRDDAEVSIICYGGGSETALAASWQLMIDEEINAEVICPSLISPLPFEEIYSFVSDTSKHIVVIDEEYADFGWSAEVVLSVLKEDKRRGMKRSADSLGMKRTFISSAKAVEDCLYPTEDEIARNIMSCLASAHPGHN